MRKILQIILIVGSSSCVGGLFYLGGVFWPLQMVPGTILVGSIGVGLCWAALISAWLHSRSDGS